MNDKYSRHRADTLRGDPQGREREEQRDWRLRESDRGLRSPDQEFETSANYREPRDPSGSAFSNRPSLDRARFDDRYAPSYPTNYGENRYGHAGRGPKGYVRTDERIREDVCDRLSWDDEVDATDITVRVQNGEVTLEGSVETRHMKRLAADIAEGVAGVVDVYNTVRVKRGMLSELKEKLSGESQETHHANTGTRTTGHQPRNGAT